MLLHRIKCNIKRFLSFFEKNKKPFFVWGACFAVGFFLALCLYEKGEEPPFSIINALTDGEIPFVKAFFYLVLVPFLLYAVLFFSTGNRYAFVIATLVETIFCSKNIFNYLFCLFAFEGLKSLISILFVVFPLFIINMIFLFYCAFCLLNRISAPCNKKIFYWTKFNYFDKRIRKETIKNACVCVAINMAFFLFLVIAIKIF